MQLSSPVSVARGANTSARSAVDKLCSLPTRRCCSRAACRADPHPSSACRAPGCGAKRARAVDNSSRSSLTEDSVATGVSIAFSAWAISAAPATALGALSALHAHCKQQSRRDNDVRCEPTACPAARVITDAVLRSGSRRVRAPALASAGSCALSTSGRRVSGRREIRV